MGARYRSGLLALVYGLTKAETDGWGAGVTLGFLAAAAVLLTAFVLIQRSSTHPLLPLRVVLDRNRGGAFAAVGLVGAGMFGVFLFLTYYLQQTLGFSPVETGLAFLPMMGALMLTATTTSAAVLPASARSRWSPSACCWQRPGWCSSPGSAWTRPTSRTCCPACS
jgi:hypothetical protein